MSPADQFNKAVFRAALKKFFAPEGMFSITDFDLLCKMVGVIPSGADRERFRLLHCVNYRDMDRDLREGLAARVMEILSGGPDPLYDLQRAIDGQAPAPKVEIVQGSLLQRLLSR